ncbi:MAG: response regulator [Lachnospiraceae bacterium]|nr:response regulator [Lachnospiraceae bacterium]
MATILIIEDDRETNDAICEYLKSAGHNTFPAYDGGEALDAFARQKIDLVVLDIMLPTITGLGVLHGSIGIAERIPNFL